MTILVVKKRKKQKLQKQKDQYLKRRTYKGILFSSIFEVEVAQYLDCCHIRWERNEKEFPVVIDDRHLKYVPDFYIPELNVYLEAKGKWFTGKEIKTEEAVKQNGLNWIIIYLHEWKRNKHILKDRLDSFKNILVFEKVV